MTEEEAKTKWCPFVRFAARGAESSGNRYGTAFETVENPAAFRCIGSECMAWRVKEEAKPAQYESDWIEWCEGNEKPKTPEEKEGWKLIDKGRDEPDAGDDRIVLWEKYSRETKPATPQTGYCGLAGNP